jgi:phage tail-like protein
MAEIHKQRPGLDPLLEANFLVEIEGMPTMGFAKCSEPNRKDAVAKYRNGNDPNYHRKQRGLRSYEDITLERGCFVDDTALQEWMDTGERKTVEIIRLDHIRETQTPSIRLYEAFPCEIQHPKGDSDSEDGVAIITLTIAYEWFDDLE